MSKKVRLFATQRVTRKAKNGKDALQIIVEPDTLVFDTDENGLVNNSELSGKYAEIRCYRGNTDVTDLCRFFFEDGDNINCNANVLVNRVSFTKINTQTIEGNEVSYSNGYVNITIKDESLNSHSVQVKFSVNITKFIGGQISNNKKFESKYSKLTAGMSEGSSIIQTAQNISLEVTKSSLKKAGIEITTDQVKLYGDKVEVVTSTKNEDGTSTDTTTAMFSNGKLNANLIDADKIEVKHLWAKSEDGTINVGYFGNYEIDACKVNDTTYAPLFVGGDTASQSSFYVTSEGAMYATRGYIGGFNIGKTSIDGINGQNKVMLTSGYISFDNKTHGIDNIIGANWKYGLDYIGQQIVVKYDHATPSYGSNIGIANLKNIALYVSASGNIDRLSRDTGIVNSVYPCGNHAIFCDKGDFAGFRPCFRIITSSQTLSKYDVFLEIVETWKKHNSITGENTQVIVGPVTLSLPTNPEIGQMYWIIRSTKYDYTLKTTDGTEIYTPGGVYTSYTLKTVNEMACIVYTGSNWRLMWNIGV